MIDPVEDGWGDIAIGERRNLEGVVRDERACAFRDRFVDLRANIRRGATGDERTEARLRVERIADDIFTRLRGERLDESIVNRRFDVDAFDRAARLPRALKNAPSTTFSTVKSKSQSERTIAGSFPPSSRPTPTKFSFATAR